MPIGIKFWAPYHNGLERNLSRFPYTLSRGNEDQSIKEILSAVQGRRTVVLTHAGAIFPCCRMAWVTHWRSSFYLGKYFPVMNSV